MGTVFSFDVRDSGFPQEELSRVIDWLHWVDLTFSTYRADSQLNRLGRGELRLTDCHRDMRGVLDCCEEMQRLSRGYFSVMPRGRLDPSGFVKGWAVERASAALAAAGAANHVINGGGDVRARGERRPGEPWRIGIVDPREALSIVTAVCTRDLAIATSGSYERGEHVVDPFTGRPATELTSLTILGRDLGTADAVATAGIAMGHLARAWLEGIRDHEGLAIRRDGTTWRTKGFDSLARGAVSPL